MSSSDRLRWVPCLPAGRCHCENTPSPPKADPSSGGRATRLMLGVYLGVLVVLGQGSSIAAENNFSTTRSFSSPYVITVKDVYLKNTMGQWVKIIDPDRIVDLSQEEPVLTFFNNMGRVPAGQYKNFRIHYIAQDTGALKTILSRQDFSKEVVVKKGSFIHVSFGLKLSGKIELEKAELTVDEDAREFKANSLILED